MNPRPQCKETIKSLVPTHDKEPQFWYALYTRSRCEKKLNQALRKNKYKTFLPLVKEKRQWSDRIKTVEAPLLPGYVFVRISKRQIQEMFYYPGMVNFVLSRGKPAVIKEEEIYALEYSLNQDMKMYPVHDFDSGEKVVITSGPFRGLAGKILQNSNGHKVILCLESLDKIFCVEMSSSDIIKIV